MILPSCRTSCGQQYLMSRLVLATAGVLLMVAISLIARSRLGTRHILATRDWSPTMRCIVPSPALVYLASELDITSIGVLCTTAYLLLSAHAGVLSVGCEREEYCCIVVGACCDGVRLEELPDTYVRVSIRPVAQLAHSNAVSKNGMCGT